MKITRTANAGVLLEAKGKKIIIDGVAGEVYPYLPTPESMKEALSDADALLYTHIHPDHFDRSFTENFRGRVFPHSEGAYYIGDIKVTAIATRHIGKWDIKHLSFSIEAEKTIWFMGDASPDALSVMEGAPDIIIAPFAYANTKSSMTRTLSKGAEKIIILHLPEREKDSIGLWDSVLENVTGPVLIPFLGETIEI